MQVAEHARIYGISSVKGRTSPRPRPQSSPITMLSRLQHWNLVADHSMAFPLALMIRGVPPWEEHLLTTDTDTAGTESDMREVLAPS